jgi:predicted dehydrogenase
MMPMPMPISAESKGHLMEQIMSRFNWIVAFVMLTAIACQPKMKAKPEKVVIMTVDPGHFHAGLIHKSMYPDMDSTVYVYAPDGDELKDYHQRLESYNSRPEEPTAWKLEVHSGQDYLEKMLADRLGNVMVVAGKNDQKIDYILSAVRKGIHVYADKPLVINPAGYAKLQEAFEVAADKNLLLYDIMTERFEITSILQKELSMLPSVFGELVDGSPEQPAITKESVHHFYKQVSGKPLIRPDWFFDVEKEGEGIVDVTTHLVDLIQWAAFPEQALQTDDVRMLAARRWATPLSLDQFRQATGKAAFPEAMQKQMQDGKLMVYSNGEMVYTLKGKHAKVSVVWDFEAPAGAGDTHYSMMRGSKAELIIRQGEEEQYKPTLYVRLLEGQDEALSTAVGQTLQVKYKGISLRQMPDGLYQVLVPESYHVGHEAHFTQVTERFLEYYKSGKMPDWEVPNMLVKYYTTTKALEMARE